jgi:hypothetical protein
MIPLFFKREFTSENLPPSKGVLNVGNEHTTKS